jgi:hypothetical protein
MATISNTPRPGYAWDATDNVWYPIGTGPHTHADYITSSSAINPTIVDAKGDIITATAADTPARLAVGNSGDTLVADSSATTGLRWTATPSASNPVLNSAMQIWQRGTSFSLAASTAYTSGYVADRWVTATNANQACTISRQATGDTTNLPNIQYALRYQRNSGQTGTGAIALMQNFESVNAIPYAGKTVTLSFYARAGANYSATSGALKTQMISGTGTDQNGFSTYTGAATVIDATATLTSTWQRFSNTGTVASTATEFEIQFNFTPVGTAGANDYYEITGVQIDIGSVALPFRTYAGTIQGELAACQRYFQVIGGTVSGFPLYGGYGLNTTANRLPIYLCVKMRTAPTITKNGTWACSNVDQPSTEFISAEGFTFKAQGNSTGNWYVHPDSTDDTLTLNAEL